MSLKDIIQKIQQETQDKIKEIEQRAQQEIKQLEKEYQSQIETKKKEILQRKKQQLQQQADQILFQKKLEYNNQLLEKKQNLIDQAYQQAYKELLAMDDKKYLAFVKELIVQLPEIEHGKIQPAKNKIKLTQQALVDSQRNFELVDENEKIKGGFMFVSPKINIDNSFQELVNKARYSTQEKVAQILFKS